MLFKLCHYNISDVVEKKMCVFRFFHVPLLSQTFLPIRLYSYFKERMIQGCDIEDVLHLSLTWIFN